MRGGVYKKVDQQEVKMTERDGEEKKDEGERQSTAQESFFSNSMQIPVFALVLALC